MRLHLFNPWHDEALANNSPYFCPSRAAIRLQQAWSTLPAWWANEGDAILIDKDLPKSWLKVVESRIPNLHFITCNELSDIDEVCPWGWNSLMVQLLKNWGIDEGLLPSNQKLQNIRNLSARATAVQVLKQIRQTNSHFIGESTICKTSNEVESFCRQYPSTLLKAPWSGSGRGLRLITKKYGNENEGWAKNIIQKQGYIVAEPFYENKIMDFALEFFADKTGRVSYCGLSLFDTQKGTYTGNIVCTEQEARNKLEKYISIIFLDELKATYRTILPTIIDTNYHGVIGVDMMLVQSNETTYIHPCVEINFRCTMGFVALNLRKQLTNEKPAHFTFTSPVSSYAIPLTPQEQGNKMQAFLIEE